MMTELNAMVKRSVAIKTYNQSKIQQLGTCTVKIRHNDKCAKCWFYVVKAQNYSGCQT